MAKISGGSGNDTLQGTSDNDTILGNGGNDALYGNDGNDSVDGGSGKDLLNGGAGNDIYAFSKGYGADTIEGSLGDRESDPIVFERGDVLKFGKGIKPSDIQLDIVAVEVEIEDWTETMYNLVLKIKGTSDSITIENYLTPHVKERGLIKFDDGTSWDFLNVYAKIRNDPDAAPFVAQYPAFLPGTEGNDYIVGTAANEYIEAFGGDDSIRAEGGDDTVLAGEGNNTVHGGGSDDWIEAGDGRDLLTGGGGDDTLVGNGGPDTIRGGAGNDVIDGIGYLQGEEGDDSLYTDGDSTLLGGIGNDYLTTYNDGTTSLLDGGDDNDRLTAYSRGDATLVGGLGDDYLSVEIGSTPLMLGGAGNDTLTAAEWIYVSGNVTVLDGGTGNDYYEGRMGIQHYVFDAGYGNDTIGMYPSWLPGIDQGPIEFGTGDAVSFGTGIDTADVSLDIVESSKTDIFDPSVVYPIWNLEVHFAGSTDSLTIEGYLTDDPASRGTLNFADGTVWDYDEVLARVADDAATAHFAQQTAALVDALASSAPAAAGGTAAQPLLAEQPVLLAAA